jgi:hypothetical protein
MLLQTWDDLEPIKQARARYFRLMDQKQWEAWATLFTEDVTAVYHNAPLARPQEGLPTLECTGRAHVGETVRHALSQGISLHQGYMPEIHLTSPTTAHGIWAMCDSLRVPTDIFKGYGHYKETYVKKVSAWKIKRIVLTRLYCDLEPR